jgi:protein-disulfide isomerase
MDNNKIEKTQKKYLKLLFIGLIIFILVAAVYYVTGQKKEESFSPVTTDLKEAGEQEEIEAIKDDNKQVIEQVQSMAIETVRPIDTTDHVWGDLDAPVQLIIYDDFQCPFCAIFYDITEEIKENFQDKVVIAFRHFPLSFHPLAVPAALASECAAKQGKFWEMYDKLFADNKENNMSVEQFREDAVAIGLNAAEFNECLDKEKYQDKIQTDMLEGRNFNVTGTPGNFINGEPVPGAYPFDDFTDSSGRQREGMKSIIERHLSAGN